MLANKLHINRIKMGMNLHAQSRIFVYILRGMDRRSGQTTLSKTFLSCQKASTVRGSKLLPREQTVSFEPISEVA